MKISIIVAVAKNNVIGGKGKLLWHIPQDLKNFKKITLGHHILMGQKTYESIGKPLPERINIILSDDKKFKAKGCFVFNNLNDALSFAKKRNEKELIVIGGGTIYKLMLPKATRIYLTKIYKSFEGDVKFPKLNLSSWKETFNEKHLDNNPPFEFKVLTKIK